MKYILGLTGQTGSGKSTLHGVAKEFGFFVIDCDAVAHHVLEENEELKNKLCSVFKTDLLTADKIDRKKLSAVAFKTKENTALLNSTIFPFIRSEIGRIIDNANSEYILLDAPTLYESGVNEECNLVVALLAEEELRKRRIIERDNLSEAAANLRLSAAKKDEFFESRAEKVIYNNGSIEEYSAEFRKILEQIKGGNCNE